MNSRAMRVVALVGVALLVVLFAAPAFAAPQSQTTTLNFSGSSSPNVDFTTQAICDECVPDAFFSADQTAYGAQVETKVTDVSFAASASAKVDYDDTLLRQGRTLNLSDTLTTIPGTVTAKGTLHSSYGLFFQNDPNPNFLPDVDQTAKDTPFTLSFACGMPLPGNPAATCSSGAVSVPIASIPAIDGGDLGSVDIAFSVAVHLDVTVTGGGVTTVRSADVLGGPAVGTNPLSFATASPSTVSDSVPLACTLAAGDTLQYSFTNVGYAPGTSAAATAAIHFEAVLSPPLLPDVNLFGGDLASVTTPSADLGLSLTAPDQTVSLGSIAKNNIPPTANAGGPYAGTEGSPVTFDGSHSTSVCGTPSMVWNFSDGGIAFGPNPQHTFADNGVYSGQLTATDATGLTSTANFSVTITNVNPLVNAGPDTTADWGRLVAFNGQAFDPGAADQATLQYSWDFGDGSPSATGGPSVLHSYSTPGANGYYDATLTVCDKDGGCVNDVRRVFVTKRDTTTSYLGDTSGTYDTPVALGASLVDEYGQNVNARSIAFQIGSDGPLTALTNSSGIATKTYTPSLASGSYTASASFAGDALYNPSSSSNGFVVAKKSTMTTYTGALNGGPNKTVTLSASLLDGTGKPLAGRTIQFALGKQNASAVTNAGGIATTTLKLNQKNGNYSVSATFTPAAADAPFYVGSSQSTIFKLQVK